MSVTDGGRTCQAWTDQFPHQHEFNTSDYFAVDGSVEAAENFCRRLAGYPWPWCFTDDKHKRWQSCREHICPGKWHESEPEPDKTDKITVRPDSDTPKLS